METKTCTSCHHTKPLEAFQKRSGGKHGRNSKCKECYKAERKEWYATNRESILEKQRSYRENLEHPREYYLKRDYGITQADYDQMLHSQGGVCAICGGEETVHRFFPVDHCHTTGKVRGLLCTKCNRGLGLLKDDYETVRKAAEYLKKFATKI